MSGKAFIFSEDVQSIQKCQRGTSLGSFYVYTGKREIDSFLSQARRCTARAEPVTWFRSRALCCLRETLPHLICKFSRPARATSNGTMVPRDGSTFFLFIVATFGVPQTNMAGPE